MRKVNLFFVAIALVLYGNFAVGQQLMNLPDNSNRFTITDITWPSNVGDAEVCLWNDDKVAAISVTIDDNIDAEHPWWLAQSTLYPDFTFTWFINSGNGTPQFGWSPFQTLVNAGHEVQPHDDILEGNSYLLSIPEVTANDDIGEPEVDHCDINYASDQFYHDTYENYNSNIEAQLGTQASVMAYPCGTEKKDVIDDLYISCRGVSAVMNPANGTEYLAVNSRTGKNIATITGWLNTDLNYLFDPAYTLFNQVYYRGWACYHFHQLNKTNEDMRPATASFLSQINDNKDELWVGGYSQIAKYGQERDSHTLTVTNVSSSQITFTLTDQMNDTYFDFPLTVKIRIDNSWTDVSATQNGSSIEADIVTYGGNKYALVKAVPDNGTVTVNADAGSGGSLPSPWATSDIGAVGAAGDATYSSGTFTVTGSGADIWNSADEFRFVYQQVSDDATITAKVNTLTNPNGWAKAGVMIRESLNANSANVISFVTPSNGTNFQYRQTTGGSTVNVAGTAGTAPYWVRLERSGNIITGYVSTNGSSWTNTGSISISMSSTYYVGLAVTAHNDGALAVSDIDNVSVQTSSTIPVTGVSVSPTSLSLNVNQTSDLTETVSPVDATDKSVIWSSNNTSVATVNTSGLVTAVSTGSATITVTTVDGGYTANCNVTVTSGSSLPSPWATSDIGAVGATGDATYSSGTFTVTGSGADIWGSADEFRFVYQQLSEDATITARVNTLTNPNSWAKAGVMIRESLNANSTNVISFVTPANGTNFQYRQTTGGSSVNVAGPAGTAPYWVRLERSGNTITGYVSTNGSSWTNTGSISISMSSTYYAGLAVTAHNDGSLAVAGIDNVTINTASSGTLPSPWASDDIGAVGAAGDATYSGSTFTVTGSGADIWGSADEFRFVYQQISGDATVTARVNTLTNPNSWAKAGVMVRESLNANSTNAISFVTPSNGTNFQYRQTTGGNSVNVTGTSGTAPYWVRLERSGNTITGYVSTNGSSWTNTGSISISMSSTYYVGLAVTAHNDGALAVADFDNVVVSGSSGGGDTQAPSVPTGLSASSVGQTSFTLNWNASTDNVGVTAYEVFKDGGSIGTSATTSMWVGGLTASTTYSMRVRARDAAGNWSAQSSALNVTTSASGGSDDWPTLATTGPSGTLTNYTGNITANTNGQIIENMNIDGKIYIKANNVTIRNCIFTALDIAIEDSYTGCVVEDCQLDWAGRQNFTLRRCYMTGQSVDLVRVSGPNVTVEDSYLHIYGPIIGDHHADCIQEYPVGTGANLVVRHNRLYNEMHQTSCIIDATDMLCEDNLMAGGSYVVYSNAGQTLINNHFSTIFYYPYCGINGTINDTPSYCSGNVIHETGEPINCTSSSKVYFAEAIQKNVNIYPNPLSGDVLNINLTGYDAEELNVKITDLTGRMVYNSVHTTQSELELPVNTLNKGVYVVSVTGEGLNNQQKLIVE